MRTINMETLKEKCEAMRATTDYRLPKKVM